MQALTIQQDAIVHLYESLALPKPDLKSLDHIRDLRVATAGHPTRQDRPKKRPQRAHFTSQATLGDSGWEVLKVEGAGQHVFRHVLIPSLGVEQEEYILALIRKE